MPPSKNNQNKEVKIRADKYDTKLALNADFESIIKIIVKDNPKK